ncbi:MAG: acyl-CoA thioesterase [Bacteroidales bacterium]
MGNINYKFSVPIQIKMSDLDPYVHVNNGFQCNYFDHGRSCYFEHLFGERIDWTQLEMVLVHIELDFYHSIDSHDQIICESKIYELGNKSFKMIQQIRDLDTNIIKTVCKSVVAGFDRQKHIAIPIREIYKQKMREFEGL